jgi:peptidylprolyl isomerase
MHKKTQISLTAAVLAVGTLTLSSCTTDGGASSANHTQASNQATTTKGPAMTSPADQYITVTGAQGSAPTLGAPQGSAPTTLITKDIYTGNGAVVLPTSTLTVQYTLLAWSTGKVVESSWTSGSPATFPLAQVIQGWQEGLAGAHEGTRRLLIIPPALGYGANAAGPIKANETLVFVVDILGVK